VYGACSTPGTATGIGFLFETPFAPLANFTNPSNGICQITSWSPGTNNYYVCTGQYVLGPAMTIPGGTVTGAMAPGPTLPFSFYVIQGATTLGPFPGSYQGADE
jgi:hypothetical protein